MIPFKIALKAEEKSSAFFLFIGAITARYKKNGQNSLFLRKKSYICYKHQFMGYPLNTEKQPNYLVEEQQALYIVSNSLKGVFAGSVDDVISVSGYEKTQIEQIMDTSYKTYSRYKKDKKRLNPDQSERILKLKSLFSFGITVFGSKESLARWMQKPAFGLDNLIPNEAIKTSTGIDLVLNELTNIAYGNLA